MAGFGFPEKRAEHSGSMLSQQAKKLIRPFRRDLVRLLRQLVQVNTVAIPPHGNETPGQVVLQDFLQEQDVRSELYATSFITRSQSRCKRKDRHYSGRKNLVVRVAGSGRGKSLLLNGHIDTVPPGKLSAWSSSPWAGNLVKNRIYGLGSFDMKAGLVAQAGVLVALRAARLRLGGDLIFESVVDEEWGGGGGTLAARLRGDSADACVISEGTQLEIYRATRGGFVVDLIVEAGDRTGYFSKTEVVSPSIPLWRLLRWVDMWSQRRRRLKQLGAYCGFPDPAPVQVLAMESNRLDPDVPLSVPSRAMLRLYFQFLPRENVDVVLREIRDSLNQFEEADPFFRYHPIQWRPLLGSPLLGHELSLEHPFTRCMIDCVTATLGRTPVVTGAPYPCDAFLVQREFRIPTLLFGPRGAGAHNPDEYAEIESVIQSAEALLATALQWCNG